MVDLQRIQIANINAMKNQCALCINLLVARRAKHFQSQLLDLVWSTILVHTFIAYAYERTAQNNSEIESRIEQLSDDRSRDLRTFVSQYRPDWPP